MKSILLAISAVLLYSIQNVILEQKLAKYDTCGLLVYFYLAMLPLALFFLSYKKITNQPVPLPEGGMILFVLLIGVIYFVADYCMLGSFTSGGKLITITTIIAMLPVTSSLMKYAWTGILPNTYQTVGYLFALAAVIFVVKGNYQ